MILICGMPMEPPVARAIEAADELGIATRCSIRVFTD